MKPLLLVALLLMTGCVSTPEDVATTEPHTYSSKLAPQAAALCIIKATERELNSATGRIEDGPKPGMITGTLRANSIGALATIEAVSTDAGSNVTIWLSRQYFAREYMLGKMTGGC